MGCSSCGVNDSGTPTGCGDKGHCTSGSCNKLNSYDWVSVSDFHDPSAYHIVEVSFKKGAHKEFFMNDPNTRTSTGDMVVVETTSGYDIGRISLSGDLVRAQMKKKYTNEGKVEFKVLRKANERDLEKLSEARGLEKVTLVKSRVIARTMGLDMKLGDIEYQGDKRKATFYYTAEGRVDFRELVKEYAKEFRVKIEMRQIGARQESARIGGIGSCGRELCCSTWLSDFKSVNTAAARYQNIAINQSKLSGQCGRLKCCLNYELDTYMDALDDFPENVDTLRTKQGRATLVKTDIFKGILYYVVDNDKMRGVFVPVPKDRVKEIQAMNQKGQEPSELMVEQAPVVIDRDAEDIDHEYEDVTGLIELKNDPRRKKKKKPSHNSGGEQNPRQARDGNPNIRNTSDQSRQGDNQNKPRRDQDRNQPANAEKDPNAPSGQQKQHPPRQERQNHPDHNNPNPEATSQSDSAQPKPENGDQTPQNRPKGKKKFFKKKGGGPKTD